RDRNVTGVQTCALPIWPGAPCRPSRTAAWTPSRRTGRWRAWAGSAGGLRGATARFSARRPLPGFVAQHPREELDGELTRPPALRSEERRAGKEGRDRRW